ncbi:MAG: hypothetical protein ACR2ND_07510 [Solirubrobacteraceae bacterium]
MRRAFAIAALATAALSVATLAGCGDVAADLFSVTRSGSVAGATFAMVPRDDGTVTCNGVRRPLPGDLLVTAREIQRAITDATTNGLRLPSGPRPVFTYSVQSSSGRLSFSDDSPHQIKALYQLAELTRQVARGVCGLAR